MKKIYTLHEYGAPSHFYGLEYLVKQHNLELKHFELNLYRQFGSGIKHLNFRRLIKLIKNIFFLLSLPFTQNKKIVLGMAPYNKDLRFIKKLLKNHQVYYFTSYSCWDQTRMAHSKHYTPDLLNIWKHFTNDQVEHIFAVSGRTKNELITNKFSAADKVSIVYHSYKESIQLSKNRNKTNRFISVGQISESKGMDELVNIFEHLTACNLTIAGRGRGRGIILEKILEASNSFENINYLGFIKGLNNLIPIYQENSFLILNSQRNAHWEELFGLVIIEAMACGLIPITTDHPGPKEIITNGVNGFICKEGEIIKGIEKANKLSNDEFFKMRNAAISKGQEFHYSKIAQRWGEILK